MFKRKDSPKNQIIDLPFRFIRNDKKTYVVSTANLDRMVYNAFFLK